MFKLCACDISHKGISLYGSYRTIGFYHDFTKHGAFSVKRNYAKISRQRNINDLGGITDGRYFYKFGTLTIFPEHKNSIVISDRTCEISGIRFK